MSETKERITIIVQRQDSQGHIWKDAIDLDPDRIGPCADPISISDSLDYLREEVKRRVKSEPPEYFTPDSNEWKKAFSETR